MAERLYARSGFVTVSNAGVSHDSRRVLSNFPISQHRPFSVTLGITVPYVQTLPKPRWNFNKADWKLFSPYIDKTCKRIPANIDNIKRFSKLILTSAKKTHSKGLLKKLCNLLVWTMHKTTRRTRAYSISWDSRTTARRTLRWKTAAMDCGHWVHGLQKV